MKSKWMPEKAREDAREMFGVKVYFVDGMVRLRDIQLAYCKESGASEESTRPAKWGETSGANELLDYLEHLKSENRTLKVKEFPKGKKGGVYVCRELAHHYAMWLDVKYAVHVLRAFDELVLGNIGAAGEAARQVCRPIFDEAWDDRLTRLRSAGHNVGEYIAVALNNLGGATTTDGMEEFIARVCETPEIHTFFNRCLDSMETAMDLGMNVDQAGMYMMEKHQNDPSVDQLLEAIA